jgi:hypothetical protein
MPFLNALWTSAREEQRGDESDSDQRFHGAFLLWPEPGDPQAQEKT